MSSELLPIPERDDSSSHMENKFELIKIDENTYEGKYPLETVMAGTRGTYGGEFVSQAILAAFETVPPLFVPNSLHSYFLKAGSTSSVMRYEILRTNDGNSFLNRNVSCYQKSTNLLCYTMIISFTKRNTHQDKVDAFYHDPSGKAPFPLEFQVTPFKFFNKYRNQLHNLVEIENTNGNMTHIIPPQFFDEHSTKHSMDKFQPGERKLGGFVKVNDTLDKAKHPVAMRFVDLAFASDSFWLACIVRVLGLPLRYKNLQFFRVSIDHSIFFHDTDFDPTEYMFMDVQFHRYQNDRLVGVVHLYDLRGKCIATITQEALVYMPNELIKRMPSHLLPKL